ncbi:hypothetical protein AG1IA_01887 [Rhizoctonia solani AG-1 IA]|uniref:Uncharacterized protein n=1 Tax=Thanatephorus cucumeris (strain AG1-IA) TaxID=983506 RepID=L8X4W9_THACA|nr:hypothetical protein AG1IA_01887 [Rhizoctonia solani AG-1 IA]
MISPAGNTVLTDSKSESNRGQTVVTSSSRETQGDNPLSVEPASSVNRLPKFYRIPRTPTRNPERLLGHWCPIPGMENARVQFMETQSNCQSSRMGCVHMAFEQGLGCTRLERPHDPTKVKFESALTMPLEECIQSGSNQCQSKLIRLSFNAQLADNLGGRVGAEDGEDGETIAGKTSSAEPSPFVGVMGVRDVSLDDPGLDDPKDSPGDVVERRDDSSDEYSDTVVDEELRCSSIKRIWFSSFILVLAIATSGNALVTFRFGRIAFLYNAEVGHGY